MPNGDQIDAEQHFLSIRSFYKQDPEWPKVQAYLDGGAAPTFTYHRFWAQSDVAMAMEDYAVLTTTAVVPALLPSSTAVTVPEGQSAAITVALSSAPAATVKVAVARTAGGDADLSVTPTSLTFTTANWATPQKLTFADALDADALDGTATFKLSATGVTGASVVATEKDKDIVATPCEIDLDTSNDWGSGQVTNVVVRNLGSTPIVNWTVSWTDSNAVTVSSAWNATAIASGRNISASAVSYDATIAAGGSVGFGMVIGYAGARPVPSNARLGGRACTTVVR